MLQTMMPFINFMENLNLFVYFYNIMNVVLIVVLSIFFAIITPIIVPMFVDFCTKYISKKFADWYNYIAFFIIFVIIFMIPRGEAKQSEVPYGTTGTSTHYSKFN